MSGMRRTKEDYRDYWEQRLSQNLDLRGTGHRAFGLELNEVLYQAQRDCLELILHKHGISLSGRRVLDVGSGTGYYVRLFEQLGAAEVVGLDITETSVRYLRDTFPDRQFHVCDIGGEQLPIDGEFDVVSVISVLYHLVDDRQFERAIANLSRLLVPDGILMVSDTFRTPLLPTASHARLRPLETYERAFSQHRLRIEDVVPMYYLLNRTFVPVIGPWMLRSRALQGWLYALDKRWRAAGRDNGRAMKLMLARKTASRA